MVSGTLHVMRTDPRVGTGCPRIITPTTQSAFELEDPGEMPGNLAKLLSPPGFEPGLCGSKIPSCV